ncbi:hypothetical protein COLO4_24624 [Corchorus olitorius]|uniref:Uncharacterized protein n=1 Tax=Corchorus olitorius TaxID=93759 RepID=A0A1R3I8M8_9ROSI|nr:hypothetical protein COLO4_24624 [Corchorus olitorius]
MKPKVTKKFPLVFFVPDLKLISSKPISKCFERPNPNRKFEGSDGRICAVDLSRVMRRSRAIEDVNLESVLSWTKKGATSSLEGQSKACKTR